MARPLTKRKKTGDVYVRPSAIEVKIDAALTKEPPALLQMIQESDRESPGYLPTECLVHLIRDAMRRDAQEIVAAVVPVLLKRCEKILNAKIPDSAFLDAADLRDEVLGEFAALLASDKTGDNPDELDYFECRFNAAFRTFRIDFVRAETDRRNVLDCLPEESDGGDVSTDDEVCPQIPEVLQAQATQERSAYVHELLNKLAPNLRRAVVLVYMMEYEIESADPSKETAATICKVTGRTIRNRLRQAVKQLLQYQ